MNLQLTGRDIEITDGLKDFINKKFDQHFKRFSNYITSIQVTLSVDKTRQKAEAQIAVRGSEIVASAVSEDMYKSIDTLIDKINHQFVKYKSKMTDHHRD